VLLKISSEHSSYPFYKACGYVHFSAVIGLLLMSSLKVKTVLLIIDQNAFGNTQEGSIPSVMKYCMVLLCVYCLSVSVFSHCLHIS